MNLIKVKEALDCLQNNIIASAIFAVASGVAGIHTYIGTKRGGSDEWCFSWRDFRKLA